METNKLSTNDQKIEFNDYFIRHQDASNTQEYMFKNLTRDIDTNTHKCSWQKPKAEIKGRGRIGHILWLDNSVMLRHRFPVNVYEHLRRFSAIPVKLSGGS